MSAEVSHILLMGIRSIQPYAPYRMLRQLGRFQTVRNDEDLSKYAIELGPKPAFLEGKIFQVWNECRFLEPKTIVRDRAGGEVDPKYLDLFDKKFQISERSTKRPHVQQFIVEAQPQWDWLTKENEYNAKISKLERQLMELQFENSVQTVADEAEKKKLTQENAVLKPHIRKMKIAANNPKKNQADVRLISGLK